MTEGQAIMPIVKKRQAKSHSSGTGDKPFPEQAKQGAFPVVAIGASAGGLEAFSQLLSALPSDTGMAFVLVQHLDPKHESALAELLGRRTTMPVEEARQGLKLQPRHIYVIPPNTDMVLAQGRLRLSARTEVAGKHLPIDLFMRSLAEEEKSRAIGVVLSGTASDGTLGLRAIKSEGGITFAQEKKSAKYDSMARSAIAAGAVDFVLPPGEIAQELGRISRHPYVNQGSASGAAEVRAPKVANLKKVFALVGRSQGVDFSGYKPTTIQRRIHRRMAVHQMTREAEYVSYLEKHPDEVKSLYNDLLIPVTSFFRDSETFETLNKTVFPTIMKNRTESEAVRMWVAGCSTGEEAYSLAIALLEFLGEKATNNPIQVFATDLSESGIQKARSGLYPKSIVHDVSPERLRRFFFEEENGYRISKSIRELCVFARHDLASDPPFSQMDLVSCRNVLIYMASGLQRRVVPILHYALKQNGVLLLGRSEAVTAFPQLFSVVDKGHRIYAKKAASSHLPLNLVGPHPPVASAKGPQPARVAEVLEPGVDAKKEADRIVLDHYAPAGVIVDGNLEVVQFRGRTGPYLEPAPGRASLNLMKMAKGELAVQLRAAIGEAKKKHTRVRRKGLQVEGNGTERNVRFEVIPLNASSSEPLFLILFASVPVAQGETHKGRVGTPGRAAEREILRLRKQLAESQENLRSVIEEYEATKEEFQATHEEVISANEELQSTNEELETSKEETQSANEELNTLNDELRVRNVELRGLNDDLVNLLTAVNMPVVLLGRDLSIRRITAAAEKQLKVIPSDVGQTISRIRLDINVPDLEPLLVDTVQTGKVWEREVQDRQGHWYSVQLFPYKTSDNKIDGAVILLQDIDVLKRAGEQQRKGREFAEAIIDTARNAFLILDSDLRVINANVAFYRTFQVSAQETERKLLYHLGNEQWNIPKLRRLLEEVLTSDTIVNDFQIEHDFPGIGNRSMLLNARRLPDLVGYGPLVLLVIEDITDRSHSETALRTAEKLATAGRMAATLAHEINNPLETVTNLIYLAENEPALEKVQQYLKEVDEELIRVAGMVKQTLGLYRQSATPAPVKISDIFGSLLSMFSPKIRNKRIQVDVDVVSEVEIRALGGDLQQVFVNLFANSIDAVALDGKIRIRLAAGHDWKGRNISGVHVSVADNGVGIPPAARTRLFEPFFTTKEQLGTGLGLWVSREIVQQHNGSLRIRTSVRPGRTGTHVSVFLPARGIDQPAGGPHAS